MAKNLNKLSFLTPVSFACYFVMSAMLAPMGILTPEMAKYFQLPITEVARTFRCANRRQSRWSSLCYRSTYRFNLRSILISTYAVLGTSLLSLGLIDDLEYVGAVLAVVGFGCGVGLAAAAVLITLRFSASKKA